MGQAVFPRRYILDDDWTIELYKYGTLYKKIKSKIGVNTTLGSCAADSGETFIGWTYYTDWEAGRPYFTSTSVFCGNKKGYMTNGMVDGGSTTGSGSATNPPGRKVKFYAIFEYTDVTNITSATTYEITSEKDRTVSATITFNSAQTVTLAARYSANNTWSW